MLLGADQRDPRPCKEQHIRSHLRKKALKITLIQCYKGGIHLLGEATLREMLPE